MKVKPKRQFMTWGLNQVTNQKQKASQKKKEEILETNPKSLPFF
jgi:hypothetical protein